MPGKRKVTVDELPVEIKDDTIYVINQPNPNSVTHNYFKYPCKFIPDIPKRYSCTLRDKGLRKNAFKKKAEKYG